MLNIHPGLAILIKVMEQLRDKAARKAADAVESDLPEAHRLFMGKSIAYTDVLRRLSALAPTVPPRTVDQVRERLTDDQELLRLHEDGWYGGSVDCCRWVLGEGEEQNHA